jgi:hypothetical protein
MSPSGLRCARPDSAARARAARRLAVRPLGTVVAVALAAAAAAQENLSFEAFDAGGLPVGWSVGGGGRIAGAGAAAEGAHSLEVTRAAADGVTRVTQRVAAAALRAGRAAPGALELRLTGLARTPASGVAASLWLRIDGARGPLFLDSEGFGREPTAAAEHAAAAPGAAPAWPGAATNGEWRRLAVELPFPADVDEVALGVSVRGAGSAWFDALEVEVVAAGARPPAAAAAVRYLDAALALMREHALKRAAVDWAAVREQALEHARGAATPVDTHSAVRFALRELGDRHSYLQSARATRALAQTAVGNARTGAPLAAPQSERLPGRLAYLAVPSFAGGTPAQQVEFAESLKNMIQAHEEQGVCGWVVDLRRNSGGNVWPMLAGLGPLLGEGVLASSVYPDGRRIDLWQRDGQAGFGAYTQLRVRAAYRPAEALPVAVLLGPGTASSAEVLAVAFKARSATRSFGAPTRGLSAGNRTFGLADGASLVLTVAATSDAAGRIYEGPLVPDELVPRAASAGTGGAADAALEAAVDWLSAGDSCR